MCCGGISGGFTLFMREGKLHWEHNYYNESRYRVSSTEKILRESMSFRPKSKLINKASSAWGVARRFASGRTGLEKAGLSSKWPATSRSTKGSMSAVTRARRSRMCTSHRLHFAGTIVRVMVDIGEATFEDLAAQHEARSRGSQWQHNKTGERADYEQIAETKGWQG